jgi:hypothetical protein
VYLSNKDYRSSFQWNYVPRSVARLALGEPPQPPPWPVAISKSEAEIFFRENPAFTSFPQTIVDNSRASRFSAGADKARAELIAGSTADYSRAEAAFKRLIPITTAPGITWQLVVYRSSKTGITWSSTEAENFSQLVWSAYSPDGTIFLCDELIEKLNPEQLAAVIAHEMAKVRTYQDALGALLRLNYPFAVMDDPYDPAAELTVNELAAGYLVKLNIPPDNLFDVLALGARGPDDVVVNPLHGDYYYGYSSAADFGRLLDAGPISYRAGS